jgi:hypothetical protein
MKSYINDLPEATSSSARLFADDCLLFRRIRKIQDAVDLQNDLSSLEEWERKWYMWGAIADPSRYLEELRRQRQVDLTCGSQVLRTEFCWSGIAWSIQGYSVVLRRIPFYAIACHGGPVRSTWRCLRSSSRYRDGSAIAPGIHKWLTWSNILKCQTFCRWLSTIPSH